MKSKLLLLLGLLAVITLFLVVQNGSNRSPSIDEGVVADSTSTPVAESPVEAPEAEPKARTAAPALAAETVPEKSVASATEPEPVATDSLDHIPAGTLRTQLSALPAPVRRKALQKLEELAPPAEDFGSLRVTADGKFYYANDVPFTPKPPALGATLATSRPSNRAASNTPSIAAASVPVATPPVHHSKPGSTNVIYLDFNGHTITGTSWNTGTGAAATYIGRTFDLDGDASTFNDAEQAVITEVWQRVAEDYSPFDIDVTTEEPATFTTTTARALITSKTDGSATPIAMPSSGGGGVAFTGVFGDEDFATKSSPALVFYDNLGNAADAIADATSHEVGHNMGLTHDGRTEEYYDGHGTGDTSWGPIMGAPYDQNVSQWSKGDYNGATNSQDDMAIVSALLSYRADEAGGTPQTAAAAGVSGSSVSNTGVIANASDLDVYSFTTASGSLSFAVSTYRAATGTHGGDADMKMELLDAGGNVLVTQDPAGTTNATLTHTASAGTYYLRLSGAAEGNPASASPTGYTTYGSTGQYTLTGTIVAASPNITSASTDSIGAGSTYSYTIVGTNGPTSYQATGLPAGLTVNTSTGVISGRPTALGVFNVSLSATNSLGTGTGSLALTVTDAAPVITAQTSGRVAVTPGAAQSLSVTALSANGDPTYQWSRNGRAITGATSATFDLSTLARGDNGYYRVSVTNTIGTTVSDVIFVLYAPTNTEVVGWGLNDNGQRTIPTGLTTAIDVVTGATHTLALKADGTVVAWGSNNDGETTVPAGLTDVVKLAAGIDVSFALKADGTVTAWGSSGFTTGNPPSGLNNVVDITASSYFALALKSDGSLVGWGSGTAQLTIPTNLGTVIEIDSGSSTVYALNSAGTIFAWGSNLNNEVSNIPAASAAWIALSGGGYHGHALKDDGTVTGWGFSGSGTPPNGLSNVVAISSGTEHNLALSSAGTLTTWGNAANTNGVMTLPTGLEKVFAIAAGDGVSLAVRDVTVAAAPSITGQPASVTVTAGASASFTVTATGFPAPTYQWRKGGVEITGATSATYTIANTTLADAASYDVVVTNATSSVTSDAATLTVQVPAAITSQPAGQTVTVGTPVTLTVAATGTPAPTYQWRKDGNAITGATASSLNLGTVALTDTGTYDVVVTNAVNSVTSDAAVVTVQEAPAITGQPQSQTVAAGAAVTFAVTATGTPAPTYQWRKGGVDIAGATNASLQLTGVTVAAAGSYDVVVTNVVTSVTSDAATLTVTEGIAITTPPASQTITVGTPVTLTIVATGTPAPTFQWRKNGNAINGATSDSLNLGTVTLADAGSYDVVLTNSTGEVTSDAAVVTVTQAPAIGTHPATQTVAAGASVTFTVVATGFPVPTYQWSKDGNTITDATSASYTIAQTTVADAGDYTVEVTNTLSSVTSDAATLTVTSGAAISTQPVSQTVTVGTQVTLTVVATGSPEPTYQWRKDGNAITGATTNTLNLGAVALTDSGSYDVVVTNTIDSATSTAAVVTVQEAPAITTQPVSQTVHAAADVTFTVVATGTPAPTYQWRKDGADITGATSASLLLTGVTADSAGSYDVVVTNAVTSVTSDAATLAVVTVTAVQASDGYRLGGSTVINNTVTYTGTLTQLVWSAMPPAAVNDVKWSLTATGGTAADVSPDTGTTDLLEFTWNTVPASPFSFSYSLATPADTTGTQNVTTMFEATSAAGTLSGVATPDPLGLTEAPDTHSADVDSNLRIDLSELLRVIELYNTRMGTSRTGRYKVEAGTTDGFASDPTAGTTQSSFHSADVDRNSQLDLSELLRVIELYNTRSGTTRTGEYHVASGTVDGFASGPAD